MPPVEEQPFDPKRLLGALRRRKVLIGGIMVLGTGLAALYIGQLTPLYSAEVALLVEGSRQNVVNIENVAQGIVPDYYTNETQAAVVRSRDLAGKVVDKLDLYNDPVFNPERRPPKVGALGALAAVVRGWFGLRRRPEAAVADPWQGYTREEKRATLRELLIDRLLAGLTVLPSQRARLLTVRFVSADAEAAARMANAVAEVYILEQLAGKDYVTRRASEWLSQRGEELRRRVIDSERRLETFRRKSGIVEVQGVNVLREQHAKVNADLINARARRIEAEARYRQVQSLMNKPRGIETAAAVLNSPLIQRLREQETIVLRKIAELETQLRDGHPRMVLVRNELKDLRSKITAEVSKIIVNLGSELEIARVRERNLSAELATLERQIERQNEAAVTLRALTTEVEANKQLYQTILSRFKETDVVGQELQQADAKIISRATVPAAPFYPQKRVMITVALFFSAALGIALAIVLELMDSGFRSLRQIEEITGLVGIGSIPRLSRSDRRQPPHRIAARRPNSIYGESVRSLRTALLLSGVDDSPSTVLVTSSVAAEGKTSLCLSLATLAARSGQRAIAVDCDFRHPTFHQVLGGANELGLTNYLGGQAELSDVIDIDPDTGMHFITAGTRAANPPDLLGSAQMRALLHKLATLYDLVVLDTPPLLAVSDALVLVRGVDRTVFLVRWEKTRRETAFAGIRQLAEAGANLAGVVLSQVDLKKQHRYGYYDGGTYYYGGNKKYYSE